MRVFRAVLNAVAQAERSLWAVVDALVAELRTGPGGGVLNGEYDTVAKYLTANGFPTWSKQRLQQLYGVGVWVNLGARPQDFREYPVEWVIEARKKAGSDHTDALRILATATKKRDIRPDQGGEARRVLSQLTPAEAANVAGEALSRPDVIDHLAEEPEKAERVLHRPASDVWQKHEEKEGVGTARVSTGDTNALTALVVRNQIRLHLMRAAELAMQHNMVGFFFEHVDDIRASLEMSVREDNPKQAVADLEAWLAEQDPA